MLLLHYNSNALRKQFKNIPSLMLKHRWPLTEGQLDLEPAALGTLFYIMTNSCIYGCLMTGTNAYTSSQQLPMPMTQLRSMALRLTQFAATIWARNHLLSWKLSITQQLQFQNSGRQSCIKFAIYLLWPKLILKAV